MNGVPNKLFEKVQKLFYWKEGEKYFKNVIFDSGEAEVERILRAGQGQTQTMRLKEENKKCNQDMFPYNAIPLFNELPNHIKVTIGTNSFTEMLTEYYKNKCQHRVDKSASSCSGCKIKKELDEVIEIDFMDIDTNFDAVSLAAYKAEVKNMKEIGNMMINVNKAVNTAFKQEKTWKQLVKIENAIWEERKNTDALKNKK